ncbi:uncharacterized protein LOC143231532 [Tachypleus tridentatus]|uniref:uncharacterized protein LOC143231532 n=1 Tax=Tachypleus tridentatus TaxID=6853 RepID=UPI003FD5133E
MYGNYTNITLPEWLDDCQPQCNQKHVFIVTQENNNSGTRSSTNFNESYPNSILSVSKVRDNSELCRSVECEQEIFSVDTSSPNNNFLGAVGCPVLTQSVKTQTLYTGILHNTLSLSSSTCKMHKSCQSETKAQKDGIKSLKENKRAVEKRHKNGPESYVCSSNLHTEPQSQTLNKGVNTAEVTLVTPDQLPDTKVASCSSTVLPGKKIQVCKWEDCDERLSSDQILEHIWNIHIELQKKQKAFVCLWKDCKVSKQYQVTYPNIIDKVI